MQHIINLVDLDLQLYHGTTVILDYLLYHSIHSTAVQVLSYSTVLVDQFLAGAINSSKKSIVD